MDFWYGLISEGGVRDESVQIFQSGIMFAPSLLRSLHALVFLNLSGGY